MKKNISPHVNIYRFPITAISSITNRITGVYLTGIFIGSGLQTTSSYGPPYPDVVVDWESNKFELKSIKVISIFINFNYKLPHQI